MCRELGCFGVEWVGECFGVDGVGWGVLWRRWDGECFGVDRVGSVLV